MKGLTVGCKESKSIGAGYNTNLATRFMNNYSFDQRVEKIINKALEHASSAIASPLRQKERSGNKGKNSSGEKNRKKSSGLNRTTITPEDAKRAEKNCTPANTSFVKTTDTTASLKL